jgi:hypothetical protein
MYVLTHEHIFVVFLLAVVSFAAHLILVRPSPFPSPDIGEDLNSSTAQSLRGRSTSTRSPTSSATSTTSSASTSSTTSTTARPGSPCFPRQKSFSQSIRRGLALIIDVGVDANLITEILDTSLAHVDPVGVLPATSNSGSRAWLSSCVPQDAVVFEEIVGGVRSGRESLDGTFVVAVGRGNPFLCSGHGAGEAHA